MIPIVSYRRTGPSTTILLNKYEMIITSHINPELMRIIAGMWDLKETESPSEGVERGFDPINISLSQIQRCSPCTGSPADTPDLFISVNKTVVCIITLFQV